MRRRERDEATAMARKRLEALSRELADAGGPCPPDPDPGARGGLSEGEKPAFFEQEPPVWAGPPADLLGTRGVVRSAVGRPLPPDPAPVPSPGRHAVRHTSGGTGEGLGAWLGDRLPLADRVGLAGAHLVVLTGVVGLALVVAGWFALRSGTSAESVPQARFVSGAESPSAAPSAPAGSGPGAPVSGAAGPSAAGGGTIVVDVIGKVRRPGIVTLPPGSRVDDAIRRAGGLRPGARTAALNLARVLIDGEQVAVGVAAAAGAPVVGGPVPGGSAAAGGAAPAGALVNLNVAGLSELDTLPGVGPVTAQKILDWRTAHGAFTAVDELLEVDGIGDKTLADIKPHVTV